MNVSARSEINLEVVSRGFGTYAFFIGLILVLTGLIIGISFTNEQNSSNFATATLLLITFTDNIQYLLRLIIVFESLLLSYERAIYISGLPTEKQLRNEYDLSIGL